MITAQDIRDKVFEKAKFNNGYDMAAVDEFLETLADEITAAQKENSVMKSKMKVLASKIEEYRENEEALNLAILSAQKLAVQIESDARARAAAMIAEAQAVVDEKLGTIDKQRADQEERLAAAEAETRSFVAETHTAVEALLKNIDAIAAGVKPAAGAKPAAEPVPAAKPIIDDIFDDDMKIASKKDDDLDSVFSF